MIRIKNFNSMTLQQQIASDMQQALKSQDSLKLSTLRMLMSAIHNAQIAGKGANLSDEEILAVVAKQVKQRRESIDSFRKGAREDLAEKEAAEMKILASYLPPQLSNEEIDKVIDEVISTLGAKTAVDIGRVMGQLSAKLKGKADMSDVSQKVKEKLTLQKGGQA